MDPILLTHFTKSFFNVDHIQITPMDNGANNSSFKIEVSKESYILRIYNNHSDIGKFLYENDILQMLKKEPLSFKVPAPIHTLNQEPYVKEDGKLAVLFPFIEGVEANRESINYQELGEKVAELSIALRNCQSTISPSYCPTYQLFNVHPNVKMKSLTKILQEINSSESIFFQEELEGLLEEIDCLVSKLPIQVIHGDLMVSNILLKEERLSGILDFEFVSPDFRMTEVAITVSQFIRENMNEELFFVNLSNFFKGYCSLIHLTKDEIQAIPILIKIRMATLVIHFLGRYFDGLDPLDIFQNQLKRFYYVGNWVNGKREKLVELLVENKIFTIE